MRNWTDAIQRRRLLAIGLAITLETAFAQIPDLDWIDATLLENRGVQIDFGGERRFRGIVRAAADIDAPAAKIWDVLVDCEAAPEYLDNVLSCELVDTLDNGHTQIFRQRAKLRWFLPSIEHEFRLDYDPTSRIVVSRVSGPFDRLDAVWWLLPESNQRTRVVYRLDLDPGPLIPKFLLTAPLRRDIVNVFEAVRARAEVSEPTD